MEKIKAKAYRFLRWSEKYTRTDMVYLARGGFWLTLGQVATTITAFGLAVAFANLLPKETYGTYQLVLSWAAIFAIATLPGIDTAIVRSIARGFEGSLTEGLKLKIRWGLWGTLAALVFAVYYFIRENNVLASTFLVVSLFVPFFSSLRIYSSLLHGKREFRLIMFYQTVANLGAALLLVTTIFFTANLLVIIVTYFASWTLLRGWLLKSTIRHFRTNKRKEVGTISYGKHLSFMEILTTTATYLDKLILFHFLGPVEVAVYTFATTPVNQIRSFLKNVYTLALPKLAVRSPQEIREGILKRVFIISAYFVPVAAIYVLMAPYLYKIFFPAYIDSVRFSQFFSLSILFAAAGVLPSAALDAYFELKRKYFLKISSNGLKIILMLLAIPFGIWGLLIGIIIAQFLSSIIVILLAKKIHDQKIIDLQKN